MKIEINKTRLIVLIMLLSTAVLAQERINVTVETKEMSQGMQTAFSVFIPESEVKMVENQWRKFINERSFFEFAGKGTAQTIEKAFIGISNIFSAEKKTFEKKSLKVEKKGNELVVRNVVHEQVTSNHVDVFAQVTGVDYGVNVSSFFKYSDSIFISESNVSEHALLSLKSYIREFGVETYRKVVEEQIFNQQKEYRKQEGVLRQLENKNKKLYNSIGKFEAEIDECNNTIRILKNELIAMEDELAAAKIARRNTSRNSPEYDQIRENFKIRKKQYKKVEREIKSEKKKITRNQTRIRKAKADILINDRDQIEQRSIVEQEELKITELKKKLANII